METSDTQTWYEAFGRRLAFARRAAGYGTCHKASLALSIDEGRLEAWEHAESHALEPDSLAFLVKAYGIDPCWLLGLPALEEEGNRCSLGPYQINEKDRTVSTADTLVRLTPKEFSLFMCLAKAAPKAATFDALRECLGCTGEDDRFRNVLGVNIHRLRSELGGGDAIANVWGIGYRLVI